MRLPPVNPSVAIGHAVTATNSANSMIEQIVAIQAVMRKEKELVKNTPNAREEQRLWRECILFLTSGLQFCRVAEVQTRAFTNPEAEAIHPAGLVNMARNISRFASRSIAALKLKRAVAYYSSGMYTLATGDLDSIDLYHNEVTADIVVAARIVYALVEVASGAPDEAFDIEQSLLEAAETIAKGSISAAKAIIGFVNLEGVSLKELRKATGGDAPAGALREGFRVEFPCIFPTKLDFDVEKHILGLLSGSDEVQATLEVMKRYTAPIDVVRITSLRRDELKAMPVSTPDAPLVAGRLIYLPLDDNQQDTLQVRTGYVVPPPVDMAECARHIQHELEALCQASGIPTDLIELRYEGPNKGYGMFAKKDLPMGTVVLKERPLFGMSMSPNCCQVCLRTTKNRRIRCRNYHAVSSQSAEVDCENVAYCSEHCREFDEVFHRTAFSCGIQNILPENRTAKQNEILSTTSPGRQMMTRMQTDASLIPYMIIRIILRLRQREQEDMIKRGIEHPTSAVLSGQGTHPSIDIFDLCPDLAVLSAAIPLQLAVTTPFVQVFRNAYRLLITAQEQHIASMLSTEELASLARPNSVGVSDKPEVIPLPVVPGKEEELASLPLPIHNIFATENLDLRTYLHLHGVIRTNTFASPEGALELFTVISMFNHSCNPNAERVIFQYHEDREGVESDPEEKTVEVVGARKDNYKSEDVYVDEMPAEAKEGAKGTTTPAKANLVSSSAAIADGPISGIRLKRPVKAGEEVFISYIDSKGRSVYERRTMLSGYGFTCACQKCTRELEGVDPI